MNEKLLLNNPIAVKLYEAVSKLPIVDFHNHLSVDDMEKDRMFGDITELWISSDPYKHRAMRILGVDENYITGDASNYDKYLKWMECLPMLIGHPLYTWSILEMKRIFDIEVPLTPENAEYIWSETKNKLSDKAFSNNAILQKFNIAKSYPCCSIADNVSFFEEKNDLAPSLRGDDMVSPTTQMIQKLENQVGNKIETLQQYQDAIIKRLDVFHNVGCRFSDHALDDGFSYVKDDGNNGERFTAALQGKEYDSVALQSYLLLFLASEYSRRKWTMQLHIGAHRRTSDRLREIAGPAGGYAAIGSPCDINSLITFLNDAENSKGGLSRTILFTLNPADSASMSIITGSFSESGVKAKIQQGPAWWWCDHTIGIRNVLDMISSYGVLSTFIGMTTDSRSILSFVRHEYFRRILCGWMGEKVATGELPDDYELLENVAKKICYENISELL